MNTQVKHTPGPWKAFNIKNGRIFKHWRVDTGTGSVTLDDAAHWEAGNAHLIAAAPAMYEALQRLFNGNVDCGTYWQIDVSDIQAAKQALAQAEGK